MTDAPIRAAQILESMARVLYDPATPKHREAMEVAKALRTEHYAVEFLLAVGHIDAERLAKAKAIAETLE